MISWIISVRLRAQEVATGRELEIDGDNQQREDDGNLPEVAAQPAG
jgi:hypothetical protein